MHLCSEAGRKTLGGPYSELEYLILAMVQNGVASGYAMRKELGRMRGGRWSSESGSVYRVLRRLQKEGLVDESRKAGVRNRERTEYELTAQGQTLLHAWIAFPPDRAEFHYLVDPIRTRSYFLDFLEPADQVRVIKSWISINRGEIQGLQKEMEHLEFANSLELCAHQNLLYLMQARHTWLRAMLNCAKGRAPVAPKASRSPVGLKV